MLPLRAGSIDTQPLVDGSANRAVLTGFRAPTGTEATLPAASRPGQCFDTLPVPLIPPGLLAGPPTDPDFAGGM
jgi:hypothetical protein